MSGRTATSTTATGSNPSTQLVFLRLHPILQQLLPVVTQLKAVCDNDGGVAGNTTTQNSRDNNQSSSNFIRLIKETTTILDDLTAAISSFNNNINGENNEFELWPSSLAVLADYVSLPLVAIFHLHLFQEQRQGDNNNDDDKTSTTAAAVRTSHIHSLYVAASRTLRTYVEQTTVTMTTTTTPTTKPNQYPNPRHSHDGRRRRGRCYLSTAHLIKFCIAITNQLPSSSSPDDPQSQSQKSTTHMTLTDPSHVSSMLLQTINVILSSLLLVGLDVENDDEDAEKKTQTTNRSNIQQLLRVWDGGLVLRLADCASHLATSTTTTTTTNETNATGSSNNNRETATTTGSNRRVKQIQLDALETLHLLLFVKDDKNDIDTESKSSYSGTSSSSSSTSLWQSIFPGIFVAIYQLLLSSSSSSTSSTTLSIAIEEKALRVLNELLVTTLVPSSNTTAATTTTMSSSSSDQSPTPTTTTTNTTTTKTKGTSTAAGATTTNSSSLFLKQLTSLAQTQNDNNSARTTNNNPQTDNQEKVKSTNHAHPSTISSSSFTAFEQNVRKGVVVPLTVVLRQESVPTRPVSVRHNVVSLCQVLLSLQTQGHHNLWVDTTLDRLPFEICIMLQQDPDGGVSNYAKSVIQSYVDTMGFNDTSFMVSRIIEMVKDLPSLVLGGKRIELRMKFQLLNGYLSSLQMKGSTAMASSDILKQSFIQIAAVDTGSIEKRSASTSIIDEDSEGSMLSSRYLDFELTSTLFNTLTVFGSSLGVKHGALFVDSILSDLIEESRSMPSDGKTYVEWIDKRLGRLVVCRLVMKGAFAEDNTGKHNPSKQSQRRMRIMAQFASSVIPLLVRSRLWELSVPLGSDLKYNPDDVRSQMAPMTLQSNACVVTLILEFLRDLFRLLKSSIQTFLPTVLYPLVEMMSEETIPSIKAASLQALKAVSAASGSLRIDETIAGYQQILVSAMLGRLRIAGGSMVPGQADKQRIMNVTKSSHWILDKINKAEIGNGKNTNVMSSWVDLMDLLHSRLAHLFVQQKLFHQEIGGVCQLYSSFYKFLIAQFGADANETYTFRMTGEVIEQKQPWRELLIPFRKASHGGFQSKEEDEFNKEEESQSLDISEKEIDLCSKLQGQGCYLLSNSSLRIRVMACDSLTMGFQFLSFVGKHHEDERDEEGEFKTNIKNSILRQVADSWPSVKARLVTLSGEISVATARGVSTFIVSVPQAPRDNNGVSNANSKIDVATQRYFLAKLFVLIAHMCQCSGDFMGERFRNHVWPIAARLLGESLDTIEELAAKQRNTNRPRLKAMDRETQIQQVDNDLALTSKIDTVGHRWTESERALILSIVQCLHDAIGNEECGKSLFSILGTVGSVLLPFLGIDDPKVADLAMETLKNILAIDCDIMLRSLFELSGQGFPPLPLLPRNIHSNDRSSVNTANTKTFNNTGILAIPTQGDGSMQNKRVSKRCLDLLDFIETLPEQALL